MNTDPPTPAAVLRQQAEAAVAARPAPLTLPTPAEAQRTLHELHVHQIELEMQNDELRRANVELEDSRSRYFDLYHLAPVGYCTLAATGLILEANLAAATLLDSPRPKLVDKPFSRFVLKEDQDVFYLAFRKLVGTGDPQTGELRMAKPDGTSFWAQLAMAMVPGSAAEPTCHVVLSDITDRKQRESVQLFLAQATSGIPGEPFFSALARFLAESLAMDFICIDRLEGDGLTARTEAVWHDGRFEDNVTYALKDTPCGEVVGKHICCFPSKVCQYFPNDLVLQNLRADSYAGTTLFDHTGKPNGLIAAISRKPLVNRPLVEATLRLVALRAAGELERLQAEETLRESEWLLSESQRIAGLGSYVLEISSGELRSSAVLDEVLGIDAAYDRTVAGWAALVHPADRAMMEDYLSREVLAQRGTFDKEYRIIRPANQAECWVHGLGKLEFDDHGDPQRMHGTVQDITDRKRAEVALRGKVEELRASNAELERFNRAMVGRELRMIELKEEINGLCQRLGEPPLHAPAPSELSDLSDASDKPTPPASA